MYYPVVSTGHCRAFKRLRHAADPSPDGRAHIDVPSDDVDLDAHGDGRTDADDYTFSDAHTHIGTDVDADAITRADGDVHTAAVLLRPHTASSARSCV
jgi:hypothetical protein